MSHGGDWFKFDASSSDQKRASQSLRESSVYARDAESVLSIVEVSLMVRAVFFSIGLFIALWGGAFLVVDKLVLSTDDVPGANRISGASSVGSPPRARRWLIRPNGRPSA